MKFKKEIVDEFVGAKIKGILKEPTVQHEMVRGESRRKCVYCDMFHSVNVRTRYYCAHPNCMLPLCSLGTGRVGSDCFGLAHASDQIRLILLQRYKKLQQNANRRPK